jgi:glycosyltransferase involved in cell wall biosynthesis
MSNQKKIDIVTTMRIPHPGGASSHIVDSYNYFIHEGFDTKLFSFKKDSEDHGGSVNSEFIIFLKVIFKVLYPLFFYKFRKTNLTIFHDPYSILLASNKLNSVLYVHGELANEILAINGRISKSLYTFLSFIELCAYKNAKFVIAVDSRIQKHVKSKLKESEKVFIMENFVNGDDFFAEPRLIFDSMRIVIARRLVEKNGVEFALEAVSNFIRKNIDVHVVCDVLGNGPLFFKLREKYQSNSVIFHGSKDRGDVVDFLKKSHINIISSIPVGEYVEATSISVLESCVSGNVTIASNVGGIAEIFASEVNGTCSFLCPPFSASCIEDSIERIYKNPNLAYIVAQSGQQFILNRFEISKYYSRLFKIVGISN